MDKTKIGTLVGVYFKLQDVKYAEKVINAVNSYFSMSDGDYMFAEIRENGVNGDNFMLSFIGQGQQHKEIADSVHQFINSFMDEFYDETLEDDWLNEMDMDEMPVIIGYEVDEAKPYIGEHE